MAELKQQMKKHVKAAKEWLGKAEQSFDQENEIRGDLNLMLAQAELKHAQETKKIGKKKKRYQSLLIHGILAASVAGLVVVAGFGGFGFTAKPVNSVIPMKAAQQALPAALHQVTEIAKPQSTKEEAPILEEPVTINPSESTEVKYKIEAVVSAPMQNNGSERAQEPEINMPPAKMQQLMRAAGKSLRGQG